MTDAELIAAVLAESGLASSRAEGAVRLEPLAGGSIAEVRRVRRPAGDIVAKLAPSSHHERLAGEASGLRAIARTGAIVVPAVLAHRRAGPRSILLLEWLEPARAEPRIWEDFGRRLAAMHAAAPPSVAGGVQDRYGWSTEIWLGTTPLPAAGTSTWPELLVEARLRPMLRRARQTGLLDADETGRLEGGLDRLARDLPATPRPSLLHGDLWSGNAHGCRDADGQATIALIDPAVQVGDAWSELGMMELFGGFPPACLDAYAEAAGGRPTDASVRIGAGRLLHALNHLLMFGRGYLTQVDEALARCRRA